MSFTLVSEKTIDSLNVTLEEYVHDKTGAQHIHVQADNNENVFLVALRTVPDDSTGVAHILEHTALCGSEKYPVRDPFFMMIRRSLNTFMNAFTSSDWTAYPFASQNRKDFQNLLEVYLDAVFFSRLDELDFKQEGHRLEFAEASNPDSDLEYKGVVFNEMKGAMSSVPSQLWQTLSSYLFNDTTYHYNSGGEPEAIPDLTYEQLVAFYKEHYHPSNAIFMTFGDITAAEHQSQFESLALNRFEKSDKIIGVKNARRQYAPKRVEEAYPFDGENADKATHVVLGWLLDESIDLDRNLEMQLISSLLLDNASSPLLQALETTKLANSPSPLCGLDDSQKEMSFVAGVEGATRDDADAIEKLIIDTLQGVVDNGLDESVVEASLHQLELQQREVGGDGFPYGLQIVMAALSGATHRGDPSAMLNLDHALESLREKVKDSGFIGEVIKRNLIDNPHRVRLSLTPDAELAQRKIDAEKAKLAQIKAGLSDDEKAQIVDLAAELQARQNETPDASLLPKVGVADVPPELFVPSSSSSQHHGQPLAIYDAGTNGLSYLQITHSLPKLSERQFKVLNYYTHFVTELGYGEFDYLQTQAQQAAVCGSYSAFASFRSSKQGADHPFGFVSYSIKALNNKLEAAASLMADSLANIRFNEHDRIKEVISQIKARKEQSVVGSGHSLAMNAASQSMSTLAAMQFAGNGLGAIQFIKELDEALQDDDKLADFANELNDLHVLLTSQPRNFCLIAEPQHIDEMHKAWGELWASAASNQAENGSPEVSPNSAQDQFWVTQAQVNYCASAYPTVTLDHADAAPLTVLGGVLRNGFLHRAIREQGGAYGGGATQDSAVGAFKFYSYRDPRLEDTFNDFESSIDWLLQHDLSFDEIEESILGVISSMDKPGSPAGEAKGHYFNEMFGRDLALRTQFRERVLATTANDIKRVCQQYLKDGNATKAVVSNEAALASAEALNMEAIKL